MNSFPRLSLMIGLVLCCGQFVPTASAFDQPASRPHFYHNVRVLAVGVDDFESPSIERLSQAEADAQQVAAVLTDKFGFQSEVLIGPRATKAAFQAKLDELQKETSADEAVILYIASHGHVIDYVATDETPPVRRRVGYLLLQDSDLSLTNPTAHTPAQWQEEAVSMRWLVDRLNQLPAQHVLVIADTCCSGFLTKRGGASSPELYNLLAGTSRTVLAATTQNESAIGGFFTPTLREQLNQCSRDAQVLTVTDLFQTLRRQVGQVTQGNQTPQMSHVGEGDGEFLFFPLTVTQTEVRAVRAQVDAITAGTDRPLRNSDRIDVTLSQLGALRGVADRVRERADRQTTLTQLIAATVAPSYWYGDRAVQETQRWQDLRSRFHENAAWGDALAMAALHVCYAKGLGEAQARPDPAAAYHWAQATLNVAQPPGLGEWVMGRCYSRGLGVSINKQTAVQLFRLSHDKGFALGTHAAAYQLMVHGLTREDILAARTMLQPLADEVPQAAILLAQHFSGAYGQGLGFPTDFASAAHYYQKAYEAGDAFSGFTLYVAYATGEPGLPPRDLPKAEAFLREAASRGQQRAQAALASELGHLPYYQTNFLNLPKNPQSARRWLELSANQGYPDACFALGRLLVKDEHGLGYQPDPTRARTFVDRAADRGHSQAMAL